VILFEPFAPPGLCEVCEAAYTMARTVVEAAGGVRAWAESTWTKRESMVLGDEPGRPRVT
jgi:hypothetical protein